MNVSPQIETSYESMPSSNGTTTHISSGNPKLVINVPPTPSATFTKPLSVPEGQASLLSSGINMLKTILGAGIITLPFAIAVFGIVPGVILMIIAALASFFGLYLYAFGASKLGRTSSPFGLAAITYPFTGYVLDTAIVLKSIGVAISYLILLGSIMSSFIMGATELTQADTMTDPRIWISLFMIIMIPLSFLKKMDHLKYSSILGIASIIYLTILSVIHAALNETAAPESIFLFNPKFTFKSIGSFGSFVFAFTCHQNIFFLHNETRKNTHTHMSGLSAICIAVSLVVYMTYGLANYISFADTFRGKTMFDTYGISFSFQMSRILFALLLAFSYPLQVLPFRNSAERLCFWVDPKRRAQLGKVFYLGLTSFFLALTFGVSMAQPDLGKIISLVGAITSSIICYILPSLYYLKLTESQPWTFSRVCACILGSFGLLVFIICSASAIYSFFV